jgi:CheY-like chemotaxis protein
MASKGRGYAIFVADDEPEVVDLVQIVLETEGHTVRSAANGRQAVERIMADPPDLILLDIRMPEMTGLTVLEHLTADPVTADIPVIMLSVVVTDPEVKEALNRGAIAYLSKPFEIRELAWLVDRLLHMSPDERQKFRQQVYRNVGRRR